jgi:hypothetical protein
MEIVTNSKTGYRAILIRQNLRVFWRLTWHHLFLGLRAGCRTIELTIGLALVDLECCNRFRETTWSIGLLWPPLWIWAFWEHSWPCWFYRNPRS